MEITTFILQKIVQKGCIYLDY